VSGYAVYRTANIGKRAQRDHVSNVIILRGYEQYFITGCLEPLNRPRIQAINNHISSLCTILDVRIREKWRETKDYIQEQKTT